jgi:hypothetical protein
MIKAPLLEFLSLAGKRAFLGTKGLFSLSFRERFLQTGKDQAIP